MAFEFSILAHNAALDGIETWGGTSPTLELRSGAKPATPETADSGTVLASMTLPADWMAVAANKSKLIAGVWEDISANAAGTVGHFRINKGAQCICQGDVTATGGGGGMTLDNVVLALGQPVTITAMTWTSS